MIDITQKMKNLPTLLRILIYLIAFFVFGMALVLVTGLYGLAFFAFFVTPLFVIFIFLFGIGYDKGGEDLPSQTQLNKSKILIEKNQEIINKYLSEFDESHRGFSVDDAVKDCIDEIAKKEKRSDLAPRYGERLSRWERRCGVHSDWLRLKNHIWEKFQERYKDLEEKREREAFERFEREELEEVRRYEEFFQKNKDIVEKFLGIAERKVSVLDEYGDENWDVLPEEIEICLQKLEKRARSDEELSDFVVDWITESGYGSGWPRRRLAELFRKYHEEQRLEFASGVDISELSGIEFETYIAKLLKENGYDVQGTPVTGDQGADLVAKKEGKTIVIQAKRHKGKVSNSAVQEVIGAVQYYQGDEGWVVTNTGFTSSAKALAQKSNVKLIDGKALENIKDFLRA